MTDGAILAKATSGALVIVSAGRTNRHQLSGAVDALQTVGAKVAGMVLSMVPTRGPDSYAYAYGYGYGYGYGQGYRYAQKTENERGSRKARRRGEPVEPALVEPIPVLVEREVLTTPDSPSTSPTRTP